jgi:hypothetical protein
LNENIDKCKGSFFNGEILAKEERKGERKINNYAILFNAFLTIRSE